MPETDTALKLDLKGLILKGIANAKGSSDAINLLTDNDFLKLGQNLANREIYHKTKLFSIIVEPVNNIEKGKKIGNYDSVFDCSTNTVPLQKVEGVKRVYFVPVTEIVIQGKETEYLAKFGKKPIVHAPNYLLGAMAKLKKADLPEDLKPKDLVAISSDNQDIFDIHGRGQCFLCCTGMGGRYRILLLVANHDWDPKHGRVFIAEDIEP